MSGWGDVVVIALVFVSLAAAVVVGRRLRRTYRSRRLQRRFGSEYDRVVALQGRVGGESQLVARLSHHQALILRDLSPEQVREARESLERAQQCFVDSPLLAVRDADHAVFEVMRSRGYPLEGIDTRAAAVSVDAPELVARYRTAYSTLVEAEQSTSPDVGALHASLLTYRQLLTVLLEHSETPASPSLTTPLDATAERPRTTVPLAKAASR